jgi:hypothetical protein
MAHYRLVDLGFKRARTAQTNAAHASAAGVQVSLKAYYLKEVIRINNLRAPPNKILPNAKLKPPTVMNDYY